MRRVVLTPNKKTRLIKQREGKILPPALYRELKKLSKPDTGFTKCDETAVHHFCKSMGLDTQELYQIKGVRGNYAMEIYGYTLCSKDSVVMVMYYVSPGAWSDLPCLRFPMNWLIPISAIDPKIIDDRSLV